MRDLPPVHSARIGLRQSGCSWWDHQANTIWIGDYETEKLMQTAANHEMNHFWMHVSTPYGRLLDELTRARNNQVLQYCIRHMQEYPFAQISIPVHDVTKQLRATAAIGPRRDLCERFARPWSHTVFLENVLEGETFPEVLRLEASAAAYSFQMVETYLQQMLALPDADSDVPDEYAETSAQGSGVPDVISPDGSRFPLGAKHVFEGIATQMTLSSPVKKEDISGGTNPYYWILWMYWVKENMRDRPVQSAEDYRRFRNTFYALCDLALFVPAGGLYHQLRGDHLNWSDIQPGYRFLLLVREAKKEDWIDNLDNEMLSYQEQMCRLLSWPLPRDFLTLGANLEDDDENARRHRDACRIRLTDHTAFLDFESRVEKDTSKDPQQKDGSANQFWTEHHPMIFLPRHGELIVRKGETAGDSLRYILDWFFANFNWSVMRSGGFSYEEFLPEKLAYDDTFQNIATRCELVDLIQQAIPVLSPERFQELE
jgi:hypothetical protein